MRWPALVVATLAIGSGCATNRLSRPSDTPPEFLLGSFIDDYGEHYRVTAGEWVQLPNTRYRIVRWNILDKYIIAQNDTGNARDGGLWTRIDWVELPGMPPWRWGFCYSAFAAPTREAAQASQVAQRATPRTGCNGHPFSRMRPSD